MKQSRRLFVKRSLLALPALSALSACGGGGTATGATGTTGTTADQTASNAVSPSNPPLPPQSNVDLSVGLKSYGTSLVPYSPLLKPAKGQTVTDPDFGTKITRISDAAKDFNATNCVSTYSSTQAWNCDETRLILYVQGPNSGGKTGWAMFDGHSYAFITFLDINPSDVEQFWWSLTDPTQLFYISNYSDSNGDHSEMTSINVETGVKTVIHDFVPDLKKLGWPATGPVRPGYPLANGGNNLIWGLGAGGIPNIDGYLALNAFGFNRQTGQITLFKGINQAEPRNMCPAPLLSGKGWFWNDTNFSADKDYETWVFDLGGNVVRKINFSSNEHVDSAMNSAGEDLMVGVQFDTPVAGNMVRANLNTGKVDCLIGPATGYGYTRTGSFAGCTAYKNRAWTVGSAVGQPYGTNNDGPTPNPKTLIDQEVYLANVDNGGVYRVAHHRSTGYWTSAPTNNYWSQPNVTISPSGTRILVNSDWGAADPANPKIDPNATTDTYVISLPQYKG